MNLSIFHPAFHTASNINPVDALFESFWNSTASNTNTTLAPRVDVFDDERNLIVEAELPGVKKGDVSVNLERSVLTIKATKKNARESKTKDYYIGERSYGAYERSFRISDDIDPESVKASFEDGVLRVEMARKPESAGRKIEVG